jgi:hypothetical protein
MKLFLCWMDFWAFGSLSILSYLILMLSADQWFLQRRSQYCLTILELDTPCTLRYIQLYLNTFNFYFLSCLSMRSDRIVASFQPLSPFVSFLFLHPPSPFSRLDCVLPHSISFDLLQPSVTLVSDSIRFAQLVSFPFVPFPSSTFRLFSHLDCLRRSSSSR